MRELCNKIKRKLLHLRFQPIRVFCFHQVSEQFDSNVYCEPDWIPLDFLKEFILRLQNDGYEFISLENAYKHIREDLIRRKKYAVLTADDGLKCQLELLPWLENKNIPLTLFINVDMLEGDVLGEQFKRYFNISDVEEERKLAEQLYFTEQELLKKNHWAAIGLHGTNHADCRRMTYEEFTQNVEKCLGRFSTNALYIPFYAYAYGTYNMQTNDILKQHGLVPVLVDGLMNYNDSSQIHREIIECK